MKELTKRLSEIQKILKVPKAQKNAFGNYYYRSCGDILESVKPLLGGLIITLSDEIFCIADRVYVKATATITDAEDSISVSAFAREPLQKKGMDESQITGSTSSYARKVALNGLLCIDDTRDADTMNNAEEGKTELLKKIKDTDKSKMTAEQVSYLATLSEQTDSNTLNSVAKKLGVI